ncbi:MAG: AAA family ATPase [Deltaproteobacteria bacterium]|nr:AAA family ATPase [Deltaproteobacteria bacterium]
MAEVLATELVVPLLVVRYEAIIASYIGETAVRIARLFDQVRSRRCVLFFYEFDVVGKERGDIREAGHIKDNFPTKSAEGVPSLLGSPFILSHIILS